MIFLFTMFNYQRVTLQPTPQPPTVEVVVVVVEVTVVVTVVVVLVVSVERGHGLLGPPVEISMEDP